jgi:hypothetical protein
VITTHHLKRGFRLGLPIGIAIGASSFTYSRSVLWSATVGTVAAALGTLCQACLEERAERRLQARGITLRDVPVRPMLLMQCLSSPHDVLQVCKEGLQNTGLRIKSVEIDDPLKLVVTTRASFYSFRERITIEVRAFTPVSCELEMSSVPWLSTTRVDGAVNYSNLFLLSKTALVLAAVQPWWRMLRPAFLIPSQGWYTGSNLVGSAI